MRSSASVAPSTTARPPGTSWSISTSVSFFPSRKALKSATNQYSFIDRDPEAEAEEKVEEEKLPGVEEEGPAAIESGFATGGADWEAPAAGFAGAGAAAAPGGWDGAAGEEWGAAAATTEWANEPAKETQW